MDTNLIIKSIKKLESEINIRKLWNVGFHRDPTKYYFAVTYPPVTLAKKISEKEIFSGYSLKGKKVALYFHIPFCSRKCTFCPYFSIVTEDTERQNYLKYLKKEIELTKKYLSEDLDIIAVYVGGGTPTLLKPDQLDDLLRFIHNEFNLSNDVEFTVETHPEIIRGDFKKYLDILKKNKVNRVSIGMQTFDDEILLSTKRGHTAEEAIKFFKEVKKYNFSCVIIDLLYGLPNQTIGSWAKDLEIAYSLNPDVVTTYCMEVKDWTPIYQQYENELFRFPNEYLYHLFYVMASEKAKQEKHTEIPVLYFPKKKDHFKYATDVFGQSEGSNVISFGTGGYSFVNGYQYFGYQNIDNYYQSIDKNQLPINKGIKLSFEDRMARNIILGLRMTSRVNKEKFKQFFNKDLNEVYKATLTKFKKLELLKENENEIYLTDSGNLFLEELCLHFIPQSTLSKLKGLKGEYDRFYRIE
ncbi:coproporphyrinogen III oxidase family protein [Patescibacteria group bacterium]|nr:coproporphyrinogen III oxidase family protein [Patescibacteria group bacterium]MBU4458546.1 coproporphyrinogen III oxidase family protein [Patescibacteria group bacterium]MCG2696313.1 coproporphyrinogen III oxidase family protein [Candidatus Portnoybacteria bacterium]